MDSSTPKITNCNLARHYAWLFAVFEHVSWELANKMRKWQINLEVADKTKVANKSDKVANKMKKVLKEVVGQILFQSKAHKSVTILGR